MIANPLTHVTSGRLRRLAVPALVVWALAWPPFLLIGEPDQMIRLQLAGSASRARDTVAGWSTANTVDMALLQGIDNVHLLAYGLFLAVAVVWAGRRLHGRAARWAPVVAWAPLLAAAFDAAENAGMTAMIRGSFEAPIPAVTTAFATAKYAMFVVVVPYVAAGIVARLRSGRAPATT